MRTLARQGALGLTAGALALVGFTIPAYAAGGSGAADLAGTVTAWGSDPQVAAMPDLGNDVVSVATGHGADYDLALHADGTVTGWGAPSTPASLPPALKDASTADVTQLSGGPAYALALKSDGSIFAWGGNKPDPATQPSLTGVTQVLAAPIAPLAVSGGHVTAWGSNASLASVPGDLSNVVQVASEVTSFLALKSDGNIVTWGIGGSTGDPLPAGLSNIQGQVAAISAGIISNVGTTAVLLKDHTVRAWNSSGELQVPAALDGKTVDQIDVNGSIVAHTTDGEIIDWSGDMSTQTVPSSLTGAPVAQVVSGYTAHDLAVVTVLRSTANPVVTGTPQVGQTLHLTPATFNLTPGSVATQWLANGAAIAGATGNSLPVTADLAGKTITVTQTATLGTGPDAQTATATSAVVGPVTTPAPAKTQATIGKLVLKPHKLAKLKKLPLAKLKKAKAVITVTTTGHTATGTVTITLKNKKITATLTNGHTTLKLKKLAKAAKKGTNKLTITYSGDTTTNNATSHTKLKLK